MYFLYMIRGDINELWGPSKGQYIHFSQAFRWFHEATPCASSPCFTMFPLPTRLEHADRAYQAGALWRWPGFGRWRCSCQGWAEPFLRGSLILKLLPTWRCQFACLLVMRFLWPQASTSRLPRIVKLDLEVPQKVHGHVNLTWFCLRGCSIFPIVKLPLIMVNMLNFSRFLKYLQVQA